MAIGNPFARDREGTQRNILVYKIATILSFLLSLIATIVYTANAPEDGHHHHRNHTIYGQSNHNITPFTPSHIFISIYWIALFLTQIGYVWHLFSENTTYVSQAAAVGSHFILFNALHFAWVMLWTRAHFFWSEVILVVNFLQMIALYLRHSKTPRWVHIPAVTMPLTWLYFAIFWNGAVLVHCRSLVCRVFANIGIWSFLFYGLFYLVVFKDYTIGFETAFLMAGLGLGQFATKIIALQWIFAFTIMSALFLFSVIIGIPGIFGRDLGIEAGHEHHHSAGADRERAPLLEDA